MAKVREKYLIDDKGKKTAVVLDVREYRRLMERLENLEDALDLDEARRASTGSLITSVHNPRVKQAARLRATGCVSRAPQSETWRSSRRMYSGESMLCSQRSRRTRGLAGS